jgi:hypothetical protein
MNALLAAIMAHVVDGTTLELELERLDARRRLHEEARALGIRVGCTLEARRITDRVAAYSRRVEKSTRQAHRVAEQAEGISLRVDEIVHRAPGNAQRGPESTPRAGRADDEWRRRGV